MSDKKVTEKRKRTPSSKVYNDSFVNNDLVKTPFESITRFYYRFDFSERTMIYYNIVFFGYIMVLLICYLIFQQNNLILTGMTQNK